MKLTAGFHFHKFIAGNEKTDRAKPVCRPGKFITSGPPSGRSRVPEGELREMRGNIGFKVFFITLILIIVNSMSTYAADPALEEYGVELGKCVKGGLVDYEGWSKDRGGLDGFLETLKRIYIRPLPPDETKAQLINAYNALMISMILDNYPVGDVLDIEPDVFSRKALNIAGEMVSLDDIEYKNLTKTGDPRVFFATVGGARGDPDLLAEPYIAEALDRQLDDAARRYLSEPKGMIVFEKEHEISLGRVFEEFGDEFGKNAGERIRYLSKFAPADMKSFLLENSDSLKIGYIEFDGSLNETREAR